MQEYGRTLLKFRVVLCLFIVGLILSGVTAFPLKSEMQLLVDVLRLESPDRAAELGGFGSWIVRVNDGLQEAYAAHPWIAYGTDWLAFAHIAIAVFFIGPLVHPVRNVWVLQAGLIACVLVVPLALICGPLRGIPLGWRLIDCSFGVVGCLPLLYCLYLVRQLEAPSTGSADELQIIKAESKP